MQNTSSLSPYNHHPQFITMTSSSNTSSPNFKRKTARISVRPPTYVNLESLSEEHQNEKTPSPPPRKKSLSPPNAPSKSTSSRSTHYTSSSSPSFIQPKGSLFNSEENSQVGYLGSGVGRRGAS
ncbi:hypothetical protein Tco_0644757 [Tanacetum coccineum]